MIGKISCEGENNNKMTLRMYDITPIEFMVWDVKRVGGGEKWRIQCDAQGVPRCDCDGYHFRKKCSHVEALEKHLMESAVVVLGDEEE